MWIIVNTETGIIEADLLVVEPTEWGEQQTPVECTLGYPETCFWDVASRGFRDVLPPPSRMIPVWKFKLLWTQAERIATRALRAADPIIDDFWDLLDSMPSDTGVDLDHPLVIAGVNYCEAGADPAPLASGRANQILAGTPPA